MKTRSKAVLWLLLAFVAGIGLGTVATLSLSHHWSVDNPSPQGSSRSSGRGSGRGSMMTEMLDQLDLDQSQADRIQGILEAGKDRMEELEESRNKEHHKIRRETVSQIRDILRPEQQQKLDEFIKEFRQEQKKRRSERKPDSDTSSP